ncbi:hypothetical protein [Hathewaya limosa]|uniref:NERD domain-containing protein n=1 Tax=Hathewaya limosa TaxID=1536 RepID=A0ABU0JSK7_HATLI|nr:hypothetical protein [Hathewaya limosa]MDQ0479064.1 hypothetical protein [Hathewaya limosa]
MGCSECNTNFKPSILIEKNEQTCKTCKKIKDFIEGSINSSFQIYHVNLQKKFNMIAPTFTGNELISINPKFIDMGLTEEDIFIDIINYLGIKNTYYTDKKAIKNICNRIMGLIIDKISDLIWINPKGYLLALLNALEYTVHLTFVTVGWLNDKNNNIEVEEITDNFGRMIIKSLKFQRDFNFLGNFEHMYKEWEGVLSFDKYALEYGIEIVTYLSGEKQLNEEKVNPNNFEKLLITIRAMYTLLYISDNACENKELIIDEQGNIITKEKNNYKEISKLYVECMTDKKISDLDVATRNKFNRVCKKYIGISLDDIFQIINGLKKHYINSDEFLIGSIDYFQKLIKHLLACSDDEAEKFLLNLVATKNDNFVYATATSLRDNRPLRKCLILIENNKVICPVSLLEFSLIGLYTDIIHATLPESDFQKELYTIVSKYIHEKFELDVMLYLQENFTGAMIKRDIKENVIPNIKTGKGFVQFSGQIDVMMLYKDKLFIIECKDIGLKYTEKSLLSELHRFSKISNKSFQEKLNTKSAEVYENWDSVIHFLGVPIGKKVERHMPISLFVVDTFSIAATEKNLPNSVVPLAKLIEWINSKYL